MTQAHHLLHGEEIDVFADAGYTGAPKRDEFMSCQAHWHIAARPSSRKRIKGNLLPTLVRQLERVKAQIRARVEHPFHIIKNLFHYKKVRDRGLAKNTAQLFALFALANLHLAKRTLQAQSV